MRRKTRVRATTALAAAGCLVAALALASCGVGGKVSEPFQDAPRGATNSSPADVIEMPDGFSNAATKCDHGNRLYVIFKADSPYGALAVVPKDSTCPK